MAIGHQRKRFWAWTALQLDEGVWSLQSIINDCRSELSLCENYSTKIILMRIFSKLFIFIFFQSHMIFMLTFKVTWFTRFLEAIQKKWRNIWNWSFETFYLGVSHISIFVRNALLWHSRLGELGWMGVVEGGGYHFLCFEIQKSCQIWKMINVNCFSYIYLIIDGKMSFVNHQSR